MKNKNHKHHVTIHQKLERLAHHKVVLTVILSFMALGYLKYETQLFHHLQDAYNQGFGFVSSYTPHHEEVTRMPVQYGAGMRSAFISGE